MLTGHPPGETNHENASEEDQVPLTSGEGGAGDLLILPRALHCAGRECALGSSCAQTEKT